MQVSTLEYIVGKEYEVVDSIEASAVEFTKDLFFNVDRMTEQYEEKIQLAKQRLIKKAEALDADAIISLKFAMLQISNAAHVITAYGTAIKYI